MSVRQWVLRFFTHTRFVPTPVYRLMVLAWLVSGVLQLIYGAPMSVRDTAAPVGWFDWAFVGAQLSAALLVMVGLYLIEENVKPFATDEEAAKYAERLQLSLTLELIGIIGLQTCIAVQVTSSAYYQGRVPSAGTTWMAIIFALWLGFRQRDIIRTQRVLRP